MAPDSLLTEWEVQVGSKVRVRGLVKASQYNGMHGTVSALNKEDDRIVVRLEGGKELKIKAQNIEVLSCIPCLLLSPCPMHWLLSREPSNAPLRTQIPELPTSAEDDLPPRPSVHSGLLG